MIISSDLCHKKMFLESVSIPLKTILKRLYSNSFSFKGRYKNFEKDHCCIQYHFATFSGTILKLVVNQQSPLDSTSLDENIMRFTMVHSKNKEEKQQQQQQQQQLLSLNV